MIPFAPFVPDIPPHDPIPLPPGCGDNIEVRYANGRFVVLDRDTGRKYYLTKRGWIGLARAR